MLQNNHISRANDSNGGNVPKKRSKIEEPTIGVQALSEEEKERILKLIENQPEVFNF